MALLFIAVVFVLAILGGLGLGADSRDPDVSLFGYPRSSGDGSGLHPGDR